MAIFSWLTQKLNGVESVVDSSKIKFSSNMSETESVYDKISDLNSDLQAGYVVNYMDISDTTPVNVNSKTGQVVTQSNFISAIALDNNVICLPYINASIQYVALKDTSLDPASGSKTIRIYYRV